MEPVKSRYNQTSFGFFILLVLALIAILGVHSLLQANQVRKMGAGAMTLRGGKALTPHVPYQSGKRCINFVFIRIVAGDAPTVSVVARSTKLVKIANFLLTPADCF